MHITACFLTMVGRGVCYKAPPQGPVWLQSHISSPAPPRLYGGLYTERFCTENLQRDGWTQKEKDISFMFLYLHLPTRRGRHHIIQSK